MHEIEGQNWVIGICPLISFFLSIAPLTSCLSSKNCIGIPYKILFCEKPYMHTDDRYYIFSFFFLHPDPIVSSKSKQNQCETLFVIQPSHRLAIKSIDIHRTIWSDPSFLEILILKCVIGITRVSVVKSDLVHRCRHDVRTREKR